MTTIVETTAGYDRWAASYETDGNPLVALDARLFHTEFAAPVTGKRLVDLGCGTGRYSLFFSERGAAVTALDASGGMLAMAHRKPGADAVTFIHHDLSRPWPLPDAAFDIVISSLVLEHIPDLAHFFSEVRRIAAPKSHIFISAMHPAMLLRGTQANFTDPDSNEKVQPRGYPHTIADFVNAIGAAGLSIARMTELVGDAELISRYPRAGQYLDWPILVAFRLSVGEAVPLGGDPAHE